MQSIPGEMDSDMSCLNKKSIFQTIPFVDSYHGSVGLVSFGHCALKKPGLEFVECLRREIHQSRERFVKSPTLYPTSYSWVWEATPCPRLSHMFAVWANHYFGYLTFFLLHSRLWMSNINIPFVYSIMEFVYLFYFSIFWTKISVSFCWNVHTVNVC